MSHGAAIRLVGAVLAGVDGSFALDHHLANTECVVLSPITDDRWSCVQWSTLVPPFYPEPDVHPVEDALQRRRSDGLIDAQTANPADTAALRAHVHPMARQSSRNACATSGLSQSASVHSGLDCA